MGEGCRGDIMEESKHLKETLVENIACLYITPLSLCRTSMGIFFPNNSLLKTPPVLSRSMHVMTGLNILGALFS
jgi:hypothetical protein